MNNISTIPVVTNKTGNDDDSSFPLLKQLVKSVESNKKTLGVVPDLVQIGKKADMNKVNKILSDIAFINNISNAASSSNISNGRRYEPYPVYNNFDPFRRLENVPFALRGRLRTKSMDTPSFVPGFDTIIENENERNVESTEIDENDEKGSKGSEDMDIEEIEETIGESGKTKDTSTEKNEKTHDAPIEANVIKKWIGRVQNNM